MAVSDVPCPAILEICNRPPSASTRSVSPMSPDPFRKSAPPTPSSRIETCKRCGVGFNAHLDFGCLGMFGRICQRFGDEVVGAHFCRVGQPLVNVHTEFHRNGGTPGEHLECGAQPAPREDRGMNAAGCLLEVRRDAGQTGHDIRNLIPERLQLRWHRSLGGAEFESQGDEPLLSAVVQIAFEAAPGVIAGCDNPGARSGELRAGLGVGDRGRCQVREVPDPLLGVRRQAVRFQRAHHGRTPQPAVHHDRRPRPPSEYPVR